MESSQATDINLFRPKLAKLKRSQSWMHPMNATYFLATQAVLMFLEMKHIFLKNNVTDPIWIIVKIAHQKHFTRSL